MRLPLILALGVAGVFASASGTDAPGLGERFGPVGPRRADASVPPTGRPPPAAAFERVAQLPAAPQERVAQLPEVTPFQAARTERMLRERVACRGCHRIRGEGGRIGPSLDGLAERATPEYVLSMILDPSRVLPGTTMPAQSMPDREAERLAAYLLAGNGAPPPPDPAPEVDPQAPPAISDAQRNDGAALYARHCAACHGPEGRGGGWNAPTLPVPPTAHADATLMSERPDDSLFDAIFAGAWVLDGSPMMPPFGDMLTAEQIRALVRHIRVLCDCEGPSWSRDGVGG